MKLKIKFIFLIVILMGMHVFCKGQQQDTLMNKLPTFNLKDINGKMLNTSEIANNGKPILICFWKTCCKPPVKMLTAINEVYEDWVDETGVVLYAISVDDARNSNLVAPFVNGKGWDYIVLLDPNSDFKRAMNVVFTPHTFLLSGDGEIVWQKAMYIPGDEEEIYKQIKKTLTNR